MEQLNRKKKARAGHRASATKIKNRIIKLLEGAEAPDTATLAQLGMSLKEKLEILKTLDSEVLDLTKEGGLAAEIDEADAYKGDIYAAMARLEEFNSQDRRAASDITRETPAAVRAPAVKKVKLPKLSIRPFNNKLTARTSF